MRSRIHDGRPGSMRVIIDICDLKWTNWRGKLGGDMAKLLIAGGLDQDGVGGAVRERFAKAIGRNLILRGACATRSQRARHEQARHGSKQRISRTAESSPHR